MCHIPLQKTSRFHCLLNIIFCVWEPKTVLFYKIPLTSKRSFIHFTDTLTHERHLVQKLKWEPKYWKLNQKKIDYKKSIIDYSGRPKVKFSKNNYKKLINFIYWVMCRGWVVDRTSMTLIYFFSIFILSISFRIWNRSLAWTMGVNFLSKNYS